MTTFWKGIAVACLGGAALEGLAAAGAILRAMRPPSDVRPEYALGDTTLSMLMVVVALIGVLTGLRAYRRLSPVSPWVRSIGCDCRGGVNVVHPVVGDGRLTGRCSRRTQVGSCRAAVVRSKASLAFAAERQVVGRT